MSWRATLTDLCRRVLDLGQGLFHVKGRICILSASINFPVVIMQTFPVSNCTALKIFQFFGRWPFSRDPGFSQGVIQCQMWSMDFVGDHQLPNSHNTNFLRILHHSQVIWLFVGDLLSRDLDLGQGGTQGQSWSMGFIGDHRLPNSRNAHFFYEIHRYSDIWHFPYTLDPHRNSKFRPFGGQNTPYTLFYFIETPKRHYLTPEHVVWAAIHTCLTPRVTGRCIEE